MNIEPLLEPISAADPCGDFSTIEDDCDKLEALLGGGSESMVEDEESTPKEPNWRQIRELSAGILARAKHLDACVFFTLAALQLDGLSGFRDGLALIRGMLERYWDAIHPQLDEDNDPSGRVAILAALCKKPGTFGDVMNFQVRLRKTPLLGAPAIRFSAMDIALAEAGAPTAVKPIAEIRAAFAGTKPEEVTAAQQILEEALASVGAIEEFLKSAAGWEHALSWSVLSETLKELLSRLLKCAPGVRNAALLATNAMSAVGTISSTLSPSVAPPDRLVGGPVQTRHDVVRCLDVICEYYKQAEPSSPIPLLLRRAQRLVDKDFMEIIRDLNPDALSAIETIAGKQPEAESN